LILIFILLGLCTPGLNYPNLDQPYKKLAYPY
jgi:hypothetical protein